jgi:Flp pilus assembly protein CpaB
VVGAFLIGVAAVGVFSAAVAGTSHPGQHWVVAARTLNPGAILVPDDLTSSTMRLSSATGAVAYRQEAAVEGRSLAVGLQAGELIQASMLVPTSREPAVRPVSLAVDPVSLAGLTDGQLVDVLTTQGTGNSTAVTVIVRGATLISVSSSTSSVVASGGSGQATIGVTTLSQVEAVVAAAHSGTITLVAAEPSDGTGPGPGSGG